MRRLLFSWLAFGVVLVALPGPVRAGDKTLVLLEVEGESTPRLLKSLERIVKTQHEVLPGSVYRDAARRLRARKLTPNNVKKVCAYLKVDGVLDGMVVAEEGSYKFLVRLRSAKDGVIEKKIPMRLAEARLSEEMTNKLAERLMPAIDDLPPVDKDGEEATRVAVDGDREKGRGKKKDKEVAVASKSGKASKKKEDEDEDGEEEKEKGKGKGKGEDEAAADGEPELADSKLSDRRRGKRGEVARARETARDLQRRVASKEAGRAGGDDVDEIEEEDAAEEDGDETANDRRDERTSSNVRASNVAAARTSPRTTPLLVHGGVSFVGRKLAFTSTTESSDPPPGYSGSPVPGVYIVGEVYPGLFAGQSGILARLGLGFIIDRVISLSSAVPDSTGTGTVDLATRMWRYGINLRYRHNFGSGPNGISVQGSLGYNTAGFSIDKDSAPGGADSVDVPNVHYKFLDIGVNGRIPITGPFSFLGELSFLGPFSTGSIQETTQYGAASVLGLETEATLEYEITPKFQVRAGARLMYIKYSFDGTGELDDRDMNGTVDVTGASDRFLGGFVTGGYCF